ncbi:uncharacterized protein N7479_006305, partial [Penicillium vulpinum]|uniref:uncharacterized protein n=1 Tax=Penicillium vulpinum TaxID=29845 RepID=UPI002547B7E4
RRQSPNYDVRLKNNKGSAKLLSASRERLSAHGKRQSGECNLIHYLASSIAATIFCPKRSKLRQIRPSRLRATRPIHILSLGLTSPSYRNKFRGNSTAPLALPRAHYSLLIPKSIISLRISRIGRSIRKRLFGILSEIRWITLSKRRGRGRGGGAAERQKRDSTTRRRNRRADQFCVHLTADKRQIPVYTVEFKAPHKVTIPELVVGLHQIDLARDMIDQKGNTFEFYATRLIAAVITQIFLYIIDSGVRYGYICTGEAFVFLYIPKDDPIVVQYFLYIPNQDEVEYLNVLKEIPETLRKDPRSSNYRPSHWKRDRKVYNIRSSARCQLDVSTLKHSSPEGSGSDQESQSLSAAAASRSRLSRKRGNKRQSRKGSERTQAGEDKNHTSR